MIKTILTQSELILYRSYAGHLCHVPYKAICKDMVLRIPLNSQLVYLGVKMLGKNPYDEYRYIDGNKAVDFITPLGALTRS
jgi:hypothetical protein